MPEHPLISTLAEAEVRDHLMLARLRLERRRDPGRALAQLADLARFGAAIGREAERLIDRALAEGRVRVAQARSRLLADPDDARDELGRLSRDWAGSPVGDEAAAALR